MGRSNGVIEIRMDRRQAFYAFVGCMLIVSVAFVVGLIVGQRMQVPSGDPDHQPSGDSRTGRLLPVAVTTEAAPEPEPFTFFDELGGGAARPSSDRPAAGDRVEESGVPGVRLLDRAPETAELAVVDDGPGPEPTPAIPEERVREERAPASRQRPERTESPPPPRPEAEPAVADRGEDDSPAETRAVTRRAVRRVQARQAEPGREDFGYYTVEAGLYASFDEADALRRRLGDGGHDAIVTLLGSDEGRRYRVQIGSFTRRSDAEDVAEEVSDLGVRARVIQES